MNKRCHVLLVEDDSMIVRMYERKLVHEGFSLTVAHNGVEGLAELKKRRPDIVLLDIMMPKLSGLDVLKTIKADPQYQDLPVVILTNLGDRAEDVRQCKDLGAEDYWVKVNLNIGELAAKINKILSGNFNQ